MYVIDLEWNACLGLKPYTLIIYLFLIFYCDVVIRQICELVSQSYTVETVRDVIWMSNNLGFLKLTDLIFELIFSQLCVIASASNRLCTQKEFSVFRVFKVIGENGWPDLGHCNVNMHRCSEIFEMFMLSMNWRKNWIIMIRAAIGVKLSRLSATQRNSQRKKEHEKFNA